MNLYHQLTQEERYRIAAERSIGTSQAQIARELNRHPSTIGREVKRNQTTHDGAYLVLPLHNRTQPIRNVAPDVRVERGASAQPVAA